MLGKRISRYGISALRNNIYSPFVFLICLLPDLRPPLLDGGPTLVEQPLHRGGRHETDGLGPVQQEPGERWGRAVVDFLLHKRYNNGQILMTLDLNWRETGKNSPILLQKVGKNLKKSKS